jgi:hypothetical protein
MAMPNYDVVHIRGEVQSALAAVRSSIWVLRRISTKKLFKRG